MFIFPFESEFDVFEERVYLFGKISKVFLISQPDEWYEGTEKNK